MSLSRYNLIASWLSKYNERSAKILGRDISKFLDTISDDLSAITCESVSTYMDGLTGFSDEVMRRKLRAIKGFCKYLSDLGHLPQGVAAQYPNKWPKPEPELRYVSPQVVKDIVDSAETERELLIIYLIYHCALSISELTSLKWRDFVTTGAHPSLHIRVAKRKRTICLPLPIAEILKDLRGEDTELDDYILTSSRSGRAPLPGRTLSGIVQRVIARTPHQVTPQILRNSLGIHILEAGGSVLDVKTALGHSSIRSTLRHARKLLKLKHAGNPSGIRKP